ncbi:uncharacterized protein TNCV_3188701 [Trichonephila clavipes]|nr:uncharacterized protein TNCV_3188701 [Trichonephila clavipes]
MKQHVLNEYSDKMNSIQLHQSKESRRKKPNGVLLEYILAMRYLAHKVCLDTASLIELSSTGSLIHRTIQLLLYGCKPITEFKEKLEIVEKLFIVLQEMLGKTMKENVKERVKRNLNKSVIQTQS